jgi:hypothetical protein
MSDDSKPAYEVTINAPGLPKGELVQIPGLDTYENGSTNEVTKEQADAYRSYHTATTVVLDDEGNPVVENDGYVFETNPGPTLLQAYNYEGATVEVTTVAKGGGS